MKGEEKEESAERGRSLATLRWTASAGAGVTIAVACLALAGWMLDWRILARFHGEYIPMAPSTALAFLFLGAGVGVSGSSPAHRARRWFAVAAAVLVCLFAALILLQSATGFDLRLEGWLTATQEIFNRVPVGRMSPITAATFLGAGLALLALVASPSRWGWAFDVAGCLAGGVTSVGLLVPLANAYGLGTAHQRAIIPVALPTAIAFMALGVALLATAAPRASTLRQYSTAALGLMAGLLASVLAFFIVHSLEDSRIQSEFQQQTEAIAGSLKETIDDVLEDLDKIEGFFATPGEVNRAQFRTYASKSMRRHRALQAFSWNPRVPAALRPAYEAAARRDGFPRFRFTEWDASGTLAEAARRAEYVVTYYVEPYQGNEDALGFDLASAPALRAALEEARNTGSVVATGPLSLAGKTGARLEVLVFRPVYNGDAGNRSSLARRQPLKGYAAATIRVGDLVEASLLGKDRAGVAIILWDVTAASLQPVLYASAGWQSSRRSAFPWERRLSVAGRQWLIEFHLIPGGHATLHTWLPWWVLGSGLLLTVLLAGHLASSTWHAGEALRLAASLRKISRAVEHSPASVMITDRQGAIEYVNPKFTQITGYAPEEASGQNPRILKSGQTPPEVYEKLWATITAGKEWRGEFLNRKKSGELFWEAASISPVLSADSHITHYVAVKEDITERKRLEEAARTRTSQLEAVRAVGVEVSRELDLRKLLDLIVQRCLELLGAGSAAVSIWEEATQKLIPRAWFGESEWRRGIQPGLGEGVTGTVALRREGMIVNDYDTSPYANPAVLERKKITAVLAEPLLYQDRLLGVLVVDNEGKGRRFTTQDRDVLALFATHAAIAIENARLFAEVKQRNQELQALYTVTNTVTRSLDIESITKAALLTTIDVLHVDAGRVFIFDEKGQVLRLTAHHGLPPEMSRASERYAPGEGIVGRIFQGGHPISFADMTSDPKYAAMARSRLGAQMGFRSAAGLPILVQGKPVGVIYVLGRAVREWSPEDLALLWTIGGQVGIAIQNGRLHADAGQHAQQAAVLNRLTRSLVRSLSPEEVSRQILEAVQALLPGAAVCLREREGDRLLFRASAGFRDRMSRLEVPLGGGLAGMAATLARVVVSDDVAQDARVVSKDWVASEGLVACAMVPMCYESQVCGTISVYTRTPHCFSEQEIELLQAFADAASIALANARLHRATLEQAAALEVRVRERTAELEEALRAKAEFLAKMSHELRTPLNFIIGFSDLLRQGVAGPLNQKQGQFVGRVHSAGQHLLQLVSDILDLSSAEAGKVLRLEEFPVADAVAETLGFLSIQSEQKRLKVSTEVEPGLRVVADRPKLGWILTNLIGNAVKFTPEGGTITVTARRIADFPSPLPSPLRGEGQGEGVQSQIAHLKSEMRDFVEIAVEDTGIGIAPENLERIFSGFEQVDSSARRQYGGTGIGLALVRTLVQLPPLEVPPRTRILVVEDDPAVAEVLVTFLSRAGYTVQETGSGSGALATIGTQRPDLVVLDIGLPDMSGWDVLQEIRRKGERAPKVLVMTGMASEDSEKAKALGADEFLTKPVSAAVVTRIVRELLAKR